MLLISWTDLQHLVNCMVYFVSLKVFRDLNIIILQGIEISTVWSEPFCTEKLCVTLAILLVYQVRKKNAHQGRAWIRKCTGLQETPGQTVKTRSYVPMTLQWLDWLCSKHTFIVLLCSLPPIFQSFPLLFDRFLQHLCNLLTKI